MYEYDLMLVVRPDVDLSDEKKRMALVQGLVGGAKVKDVAMLGKKTMEYTILKHNEATYLLAKLEGKSIHVADLEQKMKLGSDVIRYLLTRVH